MGNVGQSEYRIVVSDGSIEIRDYLPMVVAEVCVEGERKNAIRAGFKILADYIFGNNASSNKIAMTAPVMQEEQMNYWKVRFVMPKEYSIETLPGPNRNEIKLISFPQKRFAVIRFSGFPTERTIRQKVGSLKEYIARANLVASDEVVLAFYNPPWTLPFLRRNEVMIEVYPM